MENEEKTNWDNTASRDISALSSEEERTILDRLKAEIDPIALEAECRELLRQMERGELVSFEQLMQDLYGLETEDKKKSA